MAPSASRVSGLFLLQLPFQLVAVSRGGGGVLMGLWIVCHPCDVSVWFVYWYRRAFGVGPKSSLSGWSFRPPQAELSA